MDLEGFKKMSDWEQVIWLYKELDKIKVLQGGYLEELERISGVLDDLQLELDDLRIKGKNG